MDYRRGASASFDPSLPYLMFRFNRAFTPVGRLQLVDHINIPNMRTLWRTAANHSDVLLIQGMDPDHTATIGAHMETVQRLPEVQAVGGAERGFSGPSM